MKRRKKRKKTKVIEIFINKELYNSTRKINTAKDINNLLFEQEFGDED